MAMARKREHQHVAQKPLRYMYSPTGAKGETSPQEPPPKVKGNQEAKARVKVKVVVKGHKVPVGAVEAHTDLPTALGNTADQLTIIMCFRYLVQIAQQYCAWGNQCNRQCIRHHR